MKINVIITNHFEGRFREYLPMDNLNRRVKHLKNKIIDGKFYTNGKGTYVVIGKHRYFFKINGNDIILVTMYKVKLSQLINKYMTDEYSYKLHL